MVIMTRTLSSYASALPRQHLLRMSVRMNSRNTSPMPWRSLPSRRHANQSSRRRSQGILQANYYSDEGDFDPEPLTTQLGDNSRHLVGRSHGQACISLPNLHRKRKDPYTGRPDTRKTGEECKWCSQNTRKPQRARKAKDAPSPPSDS